ncbi:MAG: tetratricopeptide repeat protein [Opitutae bacterium]|nr:tetratricopeptide repeat protein [Opitutae bacterium]
MMLLKISRVLSIIPIAIAVVGIPSVQLDAADDPLLEQYFIANAAYNRKLYPVAIEQYKQFLQKNGSHAKADLARRGLAISLYALKLYDKAMPEFSTLLAKPNLEKSINRERLIMLQSKCMLNSGKKDEARKLFIEQLKNLRTPSYKTAALAAVCDVSFGKSEWSEVVEWTAKLLASKPNPDQEARGLYQRGFAYYQTQKPKEAVDSLAKVSALDANPQWKTIAAYLRGECHSILKDYVKAEPAFAEALPGLNGKDAADCQYQLGFIRFRLNKFELAIPDFEAYLKLAKPDAKGNPALYVDDARFYIARSLLEMEEYKQADRKFSEMAKGETPNTAKANLWWGRVYSRRKDNYERSAQILGEYIKRLGNKARNLPIIDDIQFDYANALIGSKNPEWNLAQAALQQIESRNKFGQMAEVVAQRATCLHKIKDFKNSLERTDNFISGYADHPLLGDIQFLRAENLYLLNRGEEAAKAFALFIKSHKDHSNIFPAQMRLAQIHHLANRWDQALSSARPLLARKPEGRLFTQLSFVVGDCLFRQDKWKESTKPLEDFVGERVEITKGDRRKITVGPNLDTALIQLAVAYDRSGEKEKALVHLLTLVDHYKSEKTTPHLPLALSEQGRLAFQVGDLKRARIALERFLLEDKGNKEPFRNTSPAQRPRVRYYLGWINASEKKHEEAAEHFSKVPHDDPLGPDAAFQYGLSLINSEEFKLAAKHFPQMIKRFKSHEKLPLLIYYSGLSTAKEEDWVNAANYFKQVTDNHSKSEFADQALYEWAWAERARKKNKEATALYEKLLATHPKSPLVIKVKSELAELNIDSGAQEKVIAELTVTLETVEDESLRETILIQLASAHFKKGDHEISAKKFEELILKYKDSKLRGSMLFQAGESRFHLKEMVVARDHFTAAAKISGLDPILAETVTMRLGETQALTGEYKDAVNTYREFLKRFGESKWLRNAQFGLGFALENNNKHKEAITEYAKLVADTKRVDLWTVRARFQTGECYFNMQNYEQAITEFVNIEINFKKYPDWQAKSVLEIGRVLLAQKKREDAIQRFKDVITRYGKEKSALVARQYLNQLRSG